MTKKFRFLTGELGETKMRMSGISFLLLLAFFLSGCVSIEKNTSTLEVLRSYAETYEPNACMGVIPHLPMPPQYVVFDIDSFQKYNDDDYGKYITLIIG